MPRRLRRLAPVLLGLGSLLASAGPLRAGDVDFPLCGDGVVQAPYETCDDGNTVSGDGCSGVSCNFEVCGDDIVNTDPAPGPAEECDDGNTGDDDGCTSPGCQLDCGDGELDGGTTPPETCDDGVESATCDDDCTAAACGDGNFNAAAGEQCDDGNTVDTDRCDALCTNGEQMFRDEQACVNEINKRFAAVARAQNADTSACVRRVAAGKSTFAGCFGLDLKGKVAGAQAKTASGEARKCASLLGPPGFAYTSAATANAAAETEATDVVTAAFGATPNLVAKAADEEGAACQAEFVKRHNKLFDTVLAELNEAKKTAIRGSRTRGGVETGTALAAVLNGALLSSEKIAKAKTGVQSGLTSKCTDARVDGLFDCGAAATVPALITCDQTAAVRAACEAMEAADALALDCN